MSGHGAPSPAPPQRSASTGPNGPLTTPTTAMVNGVTGGAPMGPGGGVGGGGGGGGAPSGSQPMSQQNLNQIVGVLFLCYMRDSLGPATQPILSAKISGSSGSMTL